MSRTENYSEITQLKVNKSGCYLCGLWGSGPEHKNTCMYVSWSVEQDGPHLIIVIYCISLVVPLFLSSDIWHDEHSFVTTLTPSVMEWKRRTLGTEVKAGDTERAQMNSLGELARPWLNKSRSKQEWCCLCELWVNVWVYKSSEENAVLSWGI